MISYEDLGWVKVDCVEPLRWLERDALRWNAVGGSWLWLLQTGEGV